MNQCGIGPEDLAWIQREQFAYFTDLERRLTDPADWAGLRLGLVAALTATWGLDTRYPAWLLRHELFSILQRRALHLLDEIHRHHDPPPTGPTSEKRSGPAVTNSETTSRLESQGPGSPGSASELAGG